MAKFSLTNNKTYSQILLINKIATTYNKLLYKYVRTHSGKIAVPKTEIEKIPKKFISLEEYKNSKSIWKQILKFTENTKVDVYDYLDTMIKNWNNIALIVNMPERKTPLAAIIFSSKFISTYEKFKGKEEMSNKLNRRLALNTSEDFYRLTPSLQSNINSLFKIKALNSDLTYHQIVEIFSGEFEQSFKDVVLNLKNEEITQDKLLEIFR